MPEIDCGIVYRVENTFGEGPYNAERSHRDVVKERLPHLFCMVDECPDRQPMPCDDIPGWYGRPRHVNWLFAFASMDALRKWFAGDDIETLREIGFSVVSYYARHIVHGGKQSMFVSETATREAIILDAA